MDKLKKSRAVERTGLTKLITRLETDLAKTPVPRNDVVTYLKLLETKVQKLAELDEKVKDLLLDDDNVEAETVEAEDQAAEEYMVKATKVKLEADEYLFPRLQPQVTPRSPTSSLRSGSAGAARRKMKLPKIDLKKFSGELVDWLGWWAQFQRIHEDDELDDSEKFSYLVQAMVKGSKSEDVIKRYPESRENYPKAILALKERFGKPKLLKQVYVRKLIQLILDNRSRDKAPLSTLYDQLEASLSSLESLGLGKENMVDFLFPMVESSLPEDILLAWQRSSNFGKDGSKEQPPKSELDFLMAFLKTEVENEEQRKLVKSGFGVNTRSRAAQKSKDGSDEDSFTAAGLLNGVREKAKRQECIFCGKGHASAECFKAQKMSLEERKTAVQKGRACYKCLKPGHQANKCRKFVKCQGCGKSHLFILCPGNVTPQKKEVESTQTVQSNLNCTSEVLLRTLIVDLENPITGVTKKVRVLLDCGSQKSYILEKTAVDLELKPTDAFRLNHELFGGTEVIGKNHRLYDVKVRAIGGKFTFRANLMDQPRICGYIPRVSRGKWMAELKQKGIWVNDLDPSNPTEIEILLGADYLGQILTAGIHNLEAGYTATETKLGWTLMGVMDVKKSGDGNWVMSNLATSVVTMNITSSTVHDLWNLEVLGIRDPVETKSQEERDREALKHFVETVKQKEDGKYSVSLPWVNGSQPLPTNRVVAERRLESTTKKLNGLGKFNDYDKVISEWKKEGIVSRVEADNSEKCHYLPHRAVFKVSKTTPVRPVFDASCKVGRNPSLNECLEKGPNILELIPSILLRFRMGEIGFSADIRKAFLMIEVKEEDRDFIRFLWYENANQKKVQVFRHNRVVFGMNCSPFLLGAVIQHHLNQLEPSQGKLKKMIQDSLYVDNLVGIVETSTEYETFKEAATGVMRNASMELRQWERSGVVGEGEVTGILGLKWDKVADVLFCDSLPMVIPPKITKRVILSHIQQVYDPLGF